MYQCLICKGNVDHIHSFITIRTLHIRSFGGVRRIQGLGNIVEGSVCKNCIERGINNALHPFKNINNLKKFALYVIMSVAGVLMAVFAAEDVIRLFGAGAALCGILCFLGDMKKINEQKRKTAYINEQQNYRRFSMELAANSLPKKNGEEDLTYIPLEIALASAPLGDLCAEYNLLLDIAKEVRNLATQFFSSAS